MCKRVAVPLGDVMRSQRKKGRAEAFAGIVGVSIHSPEGSIVSGLRARYPIRSVIA